MYKLISLVFIITISVSSFAKDVNIKVYDSTLRKNINLNVNVYTGQYTINIIDYFKSELKVSEDSIGMCGFVDKVLEDDPTTFALIFMNKQSNRKIKWKFFDNFRDLSRLEPALSRSLEKKGYRIRNLTNLTNVLIEEIKVKNIEWKTEALSLRNGDLLAKSEEDIKRMLEVAPGRFSAKGYDETVSWYEFLYCDLLRGKVSIDVSLQGSQRKYYDEQITPLKVTLDRELVSSVSDQLNAKRSNISDVAQGETDKERTSQLQLVTSVGYLAQILGDKNIKISDFEKDEFLKLATGLVNMSNGLPIKINSEQAYKIEKSLYRDAFNYKDTIPFELDATF